MARQRSKLSEALLACREALEMTQGDFAEWAGFSKASIVRWENGMRNPPRMAQRHLLVHRVASKRPDLAGPLAKGMDVKLAVAPPAVAPPAPPAPAVPVAIDARDLAVSVYAAAERLEVPSGRFRAVLAELVAAWSAAKWETAAIAKALASEGVKPRGAKARAP
jgi:DNA-binding XRE family transcriptional regulator